MIELSDVVFSSKRHRDSVKEIMSLIRLILLLILTVVADCLITWMSYRAIVTTWQTQRVHEKMCSKQWTCSSNRWRFSSRVRWSQHSGGKRREYEQWRATARDWIVSWRDKFDQIHTSLNAEEQVQLTSSGSSFWQCAEHDAWVRKYEKSLSSVHLQ